MKSMGSISENVGNNETGKGGDVPDGLYSGDKLPNISEHGCPELATQLQPLHGPGVSVWRLPEETLKLLWSKDVTPYVSSQTSDEDADRQDIF